MRPTGHVTEERSLRETHPLDTHWISLSTFILNWAQLISSYYKANELPRFSSHRASGVSHPAWQSGLMSFRLLLEPPSPWPARRGGSTQTSVRCVVYTLHVMPLMVFLIQAAEKSLSLLRSSPEQVTANLASGTFSSFVIIRHRDCTVYASIAMQDDFFPICLRGFRF